MRKVGKRAKIDRPGMARAIAAFLKASGLTLEGDLAQTPDRVAKAWAEDFLDGYRRDPATVLGALYPAPDAGLVCITGIDFHSTCPHHLLPYRGLAHVAYLPAEGARGRVAGFSRVASLVDALAHRLLLQETLARDISEALSSGTGARGAACVLEAEQACLACRAENKPRARAVASAFVGALAEEPALAQRLYRAIASGIQTARELAP